MTIRGTRNLLGAEAAAIALLCRTLENETSSVGFLRFSPSLLAERELFVGQMGDNRMYEFKDKSDRELVLIPEVTAIVRKEWRDGWERTQPKPLQLFYTSRCYRYDRPQAGRWREFTQFGVESLPDDSKGVLLPVLKACLRVAGLQTYELRESVKRGLGYYVKDGFEVWADGMQIAGGGTYSEGVGWAIGVERLLLATKDRE